MMRSLATYSLSEPVPSKRQPAIFVGVLKGGASGGQTLHILDVDHARPDRRQVRAVGDIVEDLLHWRGDEHAALELQHCCWTFLPWYKNRRDRPQKGDIISVLAARHKLDAPTKRTISGAPGPRSLPMGRLAGVRR